jgi:hypothetical protein
MLSSCVFAIVGTGAEVPAIASRIVIGRQVSRGSIPLRFPPTGAKISLEQALLRERAVMYKRAYSAPICGPTTRVYMPAGRSWGGSTPACCAASHLK